MGTTTPPIKALAALLLAIAAGCSSGTAAPVPAGRGLQVVELFQSQGCSSCPPANANIIALADQPQILVLSWQVTYWDNLGWKDSFAKSAFTQRQRDYSRSLGHNGVWTPQVVINGRGDVIGGDRRELASALRRFDRGGDALALSLSPASVTVSGSATTSSVYLVRYDPRVVQVPIRAGENGGRTLPHRNVVRDFRLLGHFAGGSRRFELPHGGEAGLRTAILVQAEPNGTIIAATHD
jgi:hypothetical protein